MEDIDYPVASTNGTTVSSDRLGLNLYFNPLWHAEHLVELDIAVTEQEVAVAGLMADGTKVADSASLRRQCHFLMIDLAEDGTERDICKAFGIDIPAGCDA